MKKFSGNIYIFGYGMVGQSFLRLLKREVTFDYKQLFVVDMSKENVEEFISEGGFLENYLTIHITKQNYLQVYQKHLQKGDVLFDFLENTRNIDTLSWCMENGVLYLNTSDSSWPEEDSHTTSYDNFIHLQKLLKKYQKGFPTAVIEIGCNPGLVSLFVKQGLKKIVSSNHNFYEKETKVKLDSLIKNKNYNQLAQSLGVDTVIISDYDTLSINSNNQNDDILYNTWSPSGLYDEAVSNIEFSLGNDFNLDLIKDKVKLFNPKDGYCLLNIKGVDTLEKTYSPYGYFEGHIITHEETLSLGSYLSVFDSKGNLLYNPTVYFSYRPSEMAFRALKAVKRKNYQRPSSFVRLKNNLSSGGEYVGVIINTKLFGAYYYGSGVELNVLKQNYPKETPTIIQVTATAISAFKWMLDNPNEGLLFPEQLNEDLILKAALKYLGSYDFHKIDDVIVPLKGLINSK